ncbi:MAG: nuclear transport factor 2 family protein [Phycisphaerales bacterium]
MNTSRVLLACFVAALTLVFPVIARAGPGERREKQLDLGGGQTLTYEIVTPDVVPRDGVYPALLVLPPGAQDPRMLLAGMQVFDPECRARGWVVVSPRAVGGKLFFQGSEKHLPALLAEVQKTVRVEGNKWHVAGASNGGISAFRFACDRPDLVRSITVLPGYPLPADEPRLGALKGIPIRMYVGSDDRVEWTDAARGTLEKGKALGLDITLDVRAGQAHRIGNLEGKEVFDMLEKLRVRQGTLTEDQAAVASVLDAFHLAASAANETAYFALFAPEGVFIGTDASERWTVPEFRAYAQPHFSKGKGWTYVPGERHVDVNPEKTVAWFDEALASEKYGACRGTGVLRKVGADWRISQYHLTVPVPNDLLPRVSALIKAEERKKK